MFTGLILAGGQSRRMGRNKALLPLHGRPLIEHAIARLQPQVAQLLVSTNAPLPLAGELPQLADTLEDAGPLAGILTGLRWLQQHGSGEWLLSVAVDTPFFPEDLAQQLWQARGPKDVIISAASGDRPHPVCSLWHLSVKEDLVGYLQTERQRRVLAFLARHPHRRVNFAIEERDPFSNFNTPQDWQQL